MISHTLLVAMILVMIPATAQAYIDPGTGALLVQILLAVIATAIVTVKLWWSRFLTLFKKDKPADNGSDHEGGEPHDQ